MLVIEGNNALRAGAMNEVVAVLEQIAEIDSEAVVTADMQDSLAADLAERLQQEFDRDDQAKVTELISGFARRFPSSRLTQKIADPVAESLLREARRHTANGDPVKSLMAMEKILRTFPKSTAAQQSREERKRVTGEVFAEAMQLRNSGDRVASTRSFRKLASNFRGTQIGDMATDELEKLATELLATVRDASVRRDIKARDEASRLLHECFSNDSLLHRIRQEFSKKEVDASRMFREGKKAEAKSQTNQAIQTYHNVVQKYSGTLAAQKAHDRVVALQPQEADVEEEEDDTLRQMMLMMQE